MTLRRGGGNHTQQAGSEVTMSAKAELLSAMTKDQLKAECRRRGFKISGNKMDLLSRLGYHKLVAASTMTAHKTNGELHSSSSSDKQHKNGPGRGGVQDKEKLVEDIDVDVSHIVLWRHPLTTTECFIKEVGVLVSEGTRKLSAYKGLVFLGVALCLLVTLLLQVKGPHQPFMQSSLTWLLWCGWWVLLGVLSSVGLGTGLHTFLLYLGPHIAQVTLAAYECGTVNFPSPPYPNEIICPDVVDPKWEVSIWNIMSKVRIEAMLWGLGTALGELPPYFMARAARLAHKPPPAQVEHIDKPHSLLDRGKIIVQALVEKVGFFGILACASIPNPLFDLAGLTCGHFLVPFWTFFGATLIGKAVIKMHIQKMFVIVAFNEKLISELLYILHNLPGGLGPKLEAPLLEFLRGQRTRLHRNSGSQNIPATSPLSRIFEAFVMAMIAFFLLSIINSLAQSYYRRVHKKQKD